MIDVMHFLPCTARLSGRHPHRPQRVGALLPVIAEMLGEAPVRTLFVDAGIPPAAGTAALGGNFRDALRELAVADILPPWSEWLGGGVTLAVLGM